MSNSRGWYSGAEKAVELLTPFGWSEESGGLALAKDRAVEGARERVKACLAITVMLMSVAILVADLGAERSVTAQLVAVVLAAGCIGSAMLAVLNVAMAHMMTARKGKKTAVGQ